RERYERQAPIHFGHNPNNSCEDKDILEDRDHTCGKHLVQRIDVRSYTCHQSAHGVLVIESDMHSLQMAKDLAAQVEHDFLAGPLHVVGLEKFKEETESEKSDVECGNLGDSYQGGGAQPTN